MIINCPECRKPVSSKAKLCNHCGHEIGDVSPEEVEEFTRRRLRDRIYHLKMGSYAAMSLLLAAFGWYWYQSPDFSAPPGVGPALLLTAGAVAYLVVRGLLIMTRRQLRALR